MIGFLNNKLLLNFNSKAQQKATEARKAHFLKILGIIGNSNRRRTISLLQVILSQIQILWYCT